LERPRWPKIFLVTRDSPLRILVVISHPWDMRLGAPRVYMELAEQWRARGNVVEKFSLSDAYPKGVGSGAKFLLRQFRFASKAAAFIRLNRDRFDVVDALVGDLPFSKTQLGFGGLLVARSVGLPQFYDEFEQSVPRRWPGRSRGRLRGRIFYEWARRRRVRASQEALAHADLVNVPNQAESEHLRAAGKASSVLVQPYGLTDERLDELRKVAAGCDARLAEKNVCFIGMWGARKGAYDWPKIIGLIRREVPNARFTFLGTMVDAPKIQAQLGQDSEHVEFVSDYEPDQLPDLLRTSTVGAFPSYVEGFGLAVLEQLAAGIPTVAFDVAGPRDILNEALPELLVPPGDLPAFAEAVSRILQADARSYRLLVDRSRSAVVEKSWGAIANNTLHSYRSALHSSSPASVVFAQPFGLSSPGGGARILRALLHDPPILPTVISTAPETPEARERFRELHIPRRPSFGRIEHSRGHSLPELVTPLFRRSFRRRLRAACLDHQAIALHAIPHRALDFYDCYLVALALRLPYFLQVHDDLLYSAKGGVNLSLASSALKQVWSGAQLRFVISRQMGEEYCRRYGRQPFVVITDGIDRVADAPVERGGNQLRIYFMGLFHIAYEENLRVLLRAITRAEAENPSVRISVTLRCGQINARDIREGKNVRILPFGSEADVARDLQEVDLVYLPLPFGETFEPFVRLSLSTKLVTYLGSGIPILYHGPEIAAVADLLAENDAAFIQTALDADSVAADLVRLEKEPALGREKAANALALARKDFTLQDQRDRFWNAIGGFVPLKCTPDPKVAGRS
jgi:glycosyltransferase involved in cell wall biosynthesis